MTKIPYYLLAVVLFLGACKKDNVEPTEACNDYPIWYNHALGNPSQAFPDATNNANNYLITLPQYALSYNKDEGKPNWVSWHVDNTWRGDAVRQNDFRPYDMLPDGWYQVHEDSYRNSGFDRGHNCPSADRTCSKDYNSATFYMINMIPQAPSNNRDVWADMEEFTRKLVDDGNEVYVIMGSYGKGGEGSNGYVELLDNGNITVPSHVWKALIILPEGEDDLLRVDTDTRVIAVIVPNKNDVGDLEWYEYITDIDEIEDETGYDLLDQVPTFVQEAIEKKVDTGPFE